MSRLFLSVFALLPGLFLYAQTYNPTVETIIGQVKLDSLAEFLMVLSGENAVQVNGEETVITHRVSNWGNDLAANYLKETLEGYGLNTVVQPYSNKGTNIYAVQEGTTYPDEYIMICSHYDAVDYYCADDNGSGSAAVLEAARIFSGHQFEYSIIYAFWDEEELGLIGSGHYAAIAASKGEVIHAVINLDMISWDGDGDRVVEIHSSYLSDSGTFADYIVEVNKLYDLNLTTSVKLPGTSASDHAEFWKNGYPSALLIEEYYGDDFNPYYHSEEDRISVLDMSYFHEMAKLALGVLASKAVPADLSTVPDDEIQLGINRQMVIYPNPFQRQTMVQYNIQKEGYVRLMLVNNLGELTDTYFEGIMCAGDHHFQLRTGNLPEGMYVLSLQTPGDVISQKIFIN